MMHIRSHESPGKEDLYWFNFSSVVEFLHFVQLLDSPPECLRVPISAESTREEIIQSPPLTITIASGPYTNFFEYNFFSSGFTSFTVSCPFISPSARVVDHLK